MKIDLEQMANRIYELEQICQRPGVTDAEKSAAEAQISTLTDYIAQDGGFDALMQIDALIQEKIQNTFDLK